MYTQKVRPMNQAGIFVLEDQMEDLWYEMAANANRSSPTREMKGLQQPTNNKIVQNLISQVEEFKRSIKQIRRREVMYLNREQDWVADRDQHAREVHLLKEIICDLEMQNNEFFHAMCRGEDRVNTSDKVYKARK